MNAELVSVRSELAELTQEVKERNDRRARLDELREKRERRRSERDRLDLADPFGDNDESASEAVPPTPLPTPGSYRREPDKSDLAKAFIETIECEPGVCSFDRKALDRRPRQPRRPSSQRPHRPCRPQRRDPRLQALRHPPREHPQSPRAQERRHDHGGQRQQADDRRPRPRAVQPASKRRAGRAPHRAQRQTPHSSAEGQIAKTPNEADRPLFRGPCERPASDEAGPPRRSRADAKHPCVARSQAVRGGLKKRPLLGGHVKSPLQMKRAHPGEAGRMRSIRAWHGPKPVRGGLN